MSIVFLLLCYHFEKRICIVHFPTYLLLGKSQKREIITAIKILLLLMKFNKQKEGEN